MNLSTFIWRGMAVAWLALAPASPLRAQDRPEHFALDRSQSGWWTGQSRILVDWNEDGPVMTGLECIASHDRELGGSEPVMEVTLSHPVESSDYRFALRFNLADTELSEREVATITVGGRPYQRGNVQSRIVPWFGAYRPGDVILAYGLGRDMFRPDESYPWLPVEFLIPRFFEVEGIQLGIAGRFEVAHGEYETRHESLHIDMDGFKETLRWCVQEVNPPSDREIRLPAELRRMIDRPGFGSSRQPAAPD